MKSYNILIKKNQNNKIDNIVLIKEGFSFYALVFSVFWFLYHKMYKEFAILLLVALSISVLGNLHPDFDKVIIDILMSVIIAINANHWRENHLKKEGYEFVDVIFGKDKEEAQINFLNQTSINKLSKEFIDPRSYRKTALMDKIKAKIV